MQDVEAAVEGGRGRRRLWGVRGGVAEEHEDVPDAELGGEGDGVVEEGEVPAGGVGGGGDVVFVLYVPGGRLVEIFISDSKGNFLQLEI